MRTCKIYCTYCGVRRGNGRETLSPANATETLAVFKKNIEHEYELNCGVRHMDIIVMNNESKTITQECIDYLELINGMETPYGKIIVHNRPNVGGSLGAYSEAFDMYQEDYDYWFFSEDDVRIIYPEYFKMIIEEFEANDKLGFLAFTKIVHEYDPKRTYVGGGFGASSTRVLSKVKKKYGKLQYDTDPNTIGNYGNFGHSELYFTNPILQMGFQIKNPSKADVVPLADNWQLFGPQRAWQTREKRFDLTDKKFLIHIGL